MRVNLWSDSSTQLKQIKNRMIMAVLTGQFAIIFASTIQSLFWHLRLNFHNTIHQV